MTAPERIVSIDVGTSKLKGLLVRADGQVEALAERSYALHSPRPGYAEQDPDEVLEACREVLAELDGGEADLVFGSAMHSLLGLDDAGQLVGPMWTWADRRAADLALEMRKSPAAEGLHARTGTPLHPMSPLVKLRYWSRQDPARVSSLSRVAGIKEYLLQRLFGVDAVDHASASAMGLLDVVQRGWDAEALRLAGVRKDQLPPLQPCATVFGVQGRRVVLGATDGLLANLGVGLDDAEGLCLTLGTSAAVRRTLRAARTDPRGRLFCYAFTSGRWVRGGAINDCGIVLQHLVQNFCPPDWDEARAVREAAAVAPGAGGLTYLPGLTGMRYPMYRDVGGSTIQGLRPEHGPAELVRAGLEGVMLRLVPLVEEVLEGAPLAMPYRAGGGVLAFDFCRQLLADTLGHAIEVADSPQSSALGGARLGLATLGADVAWAPPQGKVYAPR